MLWIFVAVFVLGTSLNTSAENLAAGVWHSQVNDLQKLQDAYKNGKAIMFSLKIFFFVRKKIEKKFKFNFCVFICVSIKMP